MSLARNVKQFRVDHGISQEYMAVKLSMHQTTYHRLEQNERGCMKRITGIAKALDTTPEALQSYHLTHNEQGEPVPADWIVTELNEKDETIQQQEETINFQNRYIAYIRIVWKNWKLSLERPNRERPTDFGH